jgi:hypothetical protein
VRQSIFFYPYMKPAVTAYLGRRRFCVLEGVLALGKCFSAKAGWKQPDGKQKKDLLNRTAPHYAGLRATPGQKQPDGNQKKGLLNRTASHYAGLRASPCL